ncbi:MAG: DUF952 domain-containing protein [Proteobacteria bacterium]|nr:DUF952 domain-containing protein [Pseudomonadota bacterium]
MVEVVYKVCSSVEWLEALRKGVYRGSADDQRDGFIHFSTGGQLRGTLDRHFSVAGGSGRKGLLLLAFDAARLGANLRWEPARDGSLFPHLYGDLDPRIALSEHPLDLDPSGRHILPGDLR